MGDKKSKAFYHRISIICIAVILSITSLTVLINNPNTAHATTLPAYRYTKSFDTTDGNAWGESLATDNLGNIYITGYFNGTVHFGGSDTLAVGIYSATFITKFNVDGTYGWTKSFNGNAWGSSIATDNLGNIYITGYFNGTVDFGGTDNFTASEGSDAFITKFNVDGTYGWTKDFIGANSTSFSYGTGIATDNLGNIYVAGDYTGTVDFGGTDNFTAGGGSDAFITKFNVDGTYGWTKDFIGANSTSYSYGNDIATDNLGNIYITGYFNGTVDFGGTDNFTASEGSDAFITKFNVDGTYGWTKDFIGANSTSYSYGYGIATDNLGNIYLTGYFSGTVHFDGTDNLNAGENQATFITKFNVDGTYGWTKDFIGANSTSYSYGYGIATDNLGNIYVSGDYSGTVDFGDSDTLTTAGDDGYVTKYNADGSYDWTKDFGVTSNSNDYFYGDDIAIDNSGNIYVTGSFGGTVTFGGLDTLTTSAESNGMFLTSYQVSESSVEPIITTTPTPYSTIKSPDTGYGAYQDNPIANLMYFVSSALVLGFLAVLARRLKGLSK